MSSIVDDMTNDWGCTLIQEKKSFWRSTKTTIDLDTEVRKSIPGFKLSSLVHSGSCANMKAIDAATNGMQSHCLVAMGSYVVGDGGPLQALSSTSFDCTKSLCTVVSPSKMYHEGRATFLKQIVALPYFVSHDRIDKEELRMLEGQCLLALKKKLWAARLRKEPYRALLMEPILSGNGGELSSDFLIGLSSLLDSFSVCVVLDEIMTGGRVGPKMTMYEELPKPFKESVSYITMGKIFGYGVVLVRKPQRPQSINGAAIRGESTKLDAGEACLKWRAIQEKINEGAIPERRRQVLKIMGWKEDSDQHWGKGCLIFSSKSRPSVLKNLKCRLLPMLEVNLKIQTLTLKDNDYSRIAVCDLLSSSAKEWMKESIKCEYEESSTPFLGSVAEYIAREEPEIIFTSDVLNDIGEQPAQKMAEMYTKKKNKNQAKPYPKKAKSYINELLLGIYNSEPCFMQKTRKSRKRKQGYLINYEEL